MAAISTIALAVGATVAAHGVSEQRQAGKHAEHATRAQAAAQTRAASAQRMEFEVQRRQADIANTRNVRSAVRQARAARAFIVNTGANTGTSRSSGVLGGSAAVLAQHNANLGFFNEIGDLNNEILSSKIEQASAAEASGIASGRLAMAQQESASAQSTTNLGMTIFGGAGGWKSIFGAKT